MQLPPTHGHAPHAFALSFTVFAQMDTTGLQNRKCLSPPAQTTRPWAFTTSDHIWPCHRPICSPELRITPPCIPPRQLATRPRLACISRYNTQTTLQSLLECTTPPYLRPLSIPTKRRCRRRSRNRSLPSFMLRPCNSSNNHNSSSRRSRQIDRILHQRRTAVRSNMGHREICQSFWAP